MMWCVHYRRSNIVIFPVILSGFDAFSSLGFLPQQTFGLWTQDFWAVHKLPCIISFCKCMKGSVKKTRTFTLPALTGCCTSNSWPVFIFPTLDSTLLDLFVFCTIQHPCSSFTKITDVPPSWFNFLFLVLWENIFLFSCKSWVVLLFLVLFFLLS